MMHLVFGTKGTGKTTLGRFLLLKNPLRRRLIIDPIGEHKGDLVVLSLRELINACEPDGRAHNAQTIVLRRFHDDENYDWPMWEFCQKLRGWRVLVDEVDRFCKPQFMMKPMEDLFNGQRHYDVDLICCSRRPAKIHNDLTSLADTLWLFRMVGVTDLQYVRETAGKQVSEKVKFLKDHAFLELTFPLQPWENTYSPITP